MPTKLIQPSFTGGEASPAVAARVDLDRYRTSLKTLRNFVVRRHGGVQNRPGTRFVVETKDSTKRSRLIRFKFNTEQAYALEVGHLYIRIVREGAQVESAPATPVEVVTPWAEADLPKLRWAQSADVMTFVHPDYQPRELRRLSETSWQLVTYENKYGPFQDENTDETKFIHASAETGPVTLTATFNVFTADMVGSLIRLEARNLRDEVWEPTKATSVGDRRRYERNVYRCAASSGSDSGTIPPTHVAGREKDGSANAWKEWLYLHSGFGIVKITGYTSATSVTGYVVKRLPEEVVGGATTAAGPWAHVGDGVDTTWSVTGATSNDPELYEVKLAGVIQPTDSYTVNATTDILTFVTAPANGVAIDIRQLDRNDRTSLWSLGAWGEETGYPSTVAYFGDRLVFGTTPADPESLAASRIGRYDEHSLSVPIQADDAFTLTINARDVNSIREMVPLKQLVLLTSGGEWVLAGDQSGVLSPETVNVSPQSSYGAADMRAEVIGNTAIYVEDGGTTVRDLAYSFESDGFSGADLMLWSDHLTQSYGITEIAYHRKPYGILWAVREDGALLSMTYLKEQEVLGWSRHDTGDGDAFESICVVPEGREDALYAIVRRTISGNTKRYIERLETRLITEIREAFFVDSGLSFDGSVHSPATLVIGITDPGASDWGAQWTMNVIATAGTPFVVGDVGSYLELEAGGESVRFVITEYTSATEVQGYALKAVPAPLQGLPTSTWAWMRKTMTGLAHLNGRSVAVLNDGNVEPHKTVTGGSITLENPGRRVHIGLPIEADFETLEVSSAESPVRDRKKVIAQVSMIVDESRGIFAGEDADHLWEFKQRNAEEYEDPTAPLTGVATIPITCGWSERGRVFVRQSDPLPLTILAAIPEFEFGG